VPRELFLSCLIIEEGMNIPTDMCKEEIERDLLGHYFWLEDRYKEAIREEMNFDIVCSSPRYRNKRVMYYFYLTIRPKSNHL
jgi:hypothetical protein